MFNIYIYIFLSLSLLYIYIYITVIYYRGTGISALCMSYADACVHIYTDAHIYLYIYIHTYMHTIATAIDTNISIHMSTNTDWWYCACFICLGASGLRVHR